MAFGKGVVFRPTGTQPCVSVRVCVCVCVWLPTPTFTRVSMEVSKLQMSVLQGCTHIVSALGSVLSVPMPKWICSEDASCRRLEMQRQVPSGGCSPPRAWHSEVITTQRNAREPFPPKTLSWHHRRRGEGASVVFRFRSLGSGTMSHTAVLVPHRILVPGLRGRWRALGAAPTTVVLGGPAAVGGQVGRPA